MLTAEKYGPVQRIETDDYAILWRAGSHSLDFHAYDSVDVDPDWPAEGAATSLLHGFLKWDGCVNIAQTSHQVMMHFCGPEEQPWLGRVLLAVYALGPQIPAWDQTLSAPKR